MKAEPNRLILRKLTEIQELLIGLYHYLAYSSNTLQITVLASYVSVSSYSEKYLPSIK